jgi:hypothetical protein
MILESFSHGKESAQIHQNEDGSYTFSADISCRFVQVTPRADGSLMLFVCWPTLDGIQNLAMLAQDLTECTNGLIVNELEVTPDA